MKFSVLGSGSRGNAVFIESGKTGILVDAGFSGKEIKARLQSIGRDLGNVKAICITHEHQDHISGAGVLSRKCNIPIYINYPTLAAGEKTFGIVTTIKEFETGNQVEIDDLLVRSFCLSHDAQDPVGYVVSDGKTSIGICTDTGKVSHLMAKRLADCKALILEFNHNLEMLQNGPYPLHLQQRVKSSIGHLSNEDAASFLSQLINNQMRFAVLAHLSETNNTPDLARQAACRTIQEWGDTSLLVAEQSKATPILEVI